MCDEQRLCETEPPRSGELWAEASTPVPRAFQNGRQGWLQATALTRIHLEEGFTGTYIPLRVKKWIFVINSTGS